MNVNFVLFCFVVGFLEWFKYGIINIESVLLFFILFIRFWLCDIIFKVCYFCFIIVKKYVVYDVV